MCNPTYHSGTLTEHIAILYFGPHLKQVDIILSDFTKAFDTVSHQWLLTKLRYEINGSTYNLIQTWLKLATCRSQCFVLDSEFSSPVPVLSGPVCMGCHKAQYLDR